MSRNVTPSDSDVEDEGKEKAVDGFSSLSDEVKEDYKNAAYWSLPENVRKAIDFAKSKEKHSDFYGRLNNVNSKLEVYNQVFYTKVPKFERVFMERKRKKLEDIMEKE